MGDNSGSGRLLIAIGDAVVLIVIVSFVVVRRRVRRRDVHQLMLHFLFYLCVNKIGLDTIVALAIATSH